MLLLCMAAQVSQALPKDGTSETPAASPELEIPSPAPPSETYAANLCPTVMSLGEDISAIARKQLGVRYRRGGISPRSGFDCSGFVYWVFAEHGVQLPRTSVQQSDAGHAVAKSDLLPGDILIFRIPHTPNGRHSAIYIGEGLFIHSPTSGACVRIENLSDHYWEKHYHTARRVLKAPPCDLDLHSDPDTVNAEFLSGISLPSPGSPQSPADPCTH